MEKFALISVYDKSGIVDFARELISLGYNILATGNTAKLIRENGLSCTDVEKLTGFPEVFHGRVKTLHPKIFGGILYRRDSDEDRKDTAELEIPNIEIVCVNLYPFEQVAEKHPENLALLIENIDIGGPSLIRAAAKNYNSVSIVTHPSQYNVVLNELKIGEVSLSTRKKLALDAFNKTAAYDIFIGKVLAPLLEKEDEYLRTFARRESVLRYGENPHQSAVVYGNFSEYFKVIHGKELSYNNILDICSAAELTAEFNEPFCGIIKHNSPCGAAVASDIGEAYQKALKGDPVSAFGGIVSFNRPVDLELAELLNEIFLEVIIAPEFEESALPVLKKKKDRRLIRQLKFPEVNTQIKTIPGGYLTQSNDTGFDELSKLDVKTVLTPDESIIKDMEFAWKIVKHVRSNAIVFAKSGMTIGIGGGQVSRIDSVKIAKMKAIDRVLDTTNAVCASDAFFPFPDAVELCKEYGIKAIIQPGGSIRDDEVIKKANELGLMMVFTGKRHFKH